MCTCALFPPINAEQVMDATGNLNGVSPPFRLINPAGVIISGDAYDATVNKGDTSTVEWEFTGDSFPVSGRDKGKCER